jgi:hypothetical protein
MKMSKMMIRLIPASAALLWLASGTAQATPFTFEFDMPAWTFGFDTSIYGSNAILDLTFDNGAATDLNQTYLNSQITQVTVTTVGGTFADTWTDGFFASPGSASYVSTDANGVATLNLLAGAVTTGFDVDNAIGDFQIGVITATAGGFTSFVVGGPGFSDAASVVPTGPSGEFTGFEVTSVSTPTSVPEPGTFAMMGLGLAGVGFVLRRKSAAAA